MARIASSISASVRARRSCRPPDSRLPQQTVAFFASDLVLEIPRLNVRLEIVGVPQDDSGWDLSWLGRRAGWLEGSAFPTWAGNSVVTAHVWNADNTPGPFVNLHQVWCGDQIIIQAFGQQYIYEVRSVQRVSPGAFDAVFRHETRPWLTLLTCHGYDQAAGSYRYRIVVRAVQVEIR